MEAISTHNSALLALLKRIFLQNTQPVPATHSRGWKLKGFSLFSAFIFLIGVNGWGQTTANNYTFSSGSGSAIIPTYTQLVASGIDDGLSSVTNIGFNFTYEGTTYTQFCASSNGLMKLGSTDLGTGTWSNNIADNTTYPAHRPKIMPWWDDVSTASNGGVHYGVFGSAPNRILVVRFRLRWTTLVSEPYNLEFQVRLYETTNKIEFYYQSGGTYLNSVSCGIGGAIATNYISVTAGASPSSSTSTPNNSNNTFPSANALYTFTPPVVCSATTYYSKSTGNLDQTSSWSSTADGTGCSPANFTTAGVTYIIQQNLAGNATRTIGANWTVSGAGSKVVLGQASAAAVTFTVPSSFSFTGTIDVPAALSLSNTLVLNNTTVPTLGTLHSGSTVKYNATGSQTIQATTYGNLETGVESGTSNSTKTVSASGTLSIAGNLTINDYSTFNLNDRDMTLTGDFIRSSTASPTTSLFSHGSGTSNTVTFNGSSQEVNVTAANGTTPTNGDITFNHVVIDGASVKLFYFKTNDRKLNINNFTVNSGKVVTLYSNPQ